MKTLKRIFLIVIAVLFSYCIQGQVSGVKDDISKAQDLAKQGNTTEASRLYLDIMSKYPDNREAVQGWLMINMKRSSTGEEEAIKQLEELEKTNQNNTAILFFKAFLQTEYKHLDEALKTAEKLVNMKPEDGLNWLLKGQINEALNQNEEALSSYEKATSLGPENADTWQNKAGLLAKTNKLDEAVISYTRAIELAPTQPVFIYNRGCVYSRKGDKANALIDLGKAVSMNQQFKEYASKDEDFKSLWEDPDFKKIISQ
jgi:tetratricopeptide (TPR) repeat protein